MIVHLEHFDTHSSTNNIEIFEINDIICLNITIQIYYKLFTTLHIILKYIIDELHVNNMQQQKKHCVYIRNHICVYILVGIKNLSAVQRPYEYTVSHSSGTWGVIQLGSSTPRSTHL